MTLKMVNVYSQEIFEVSNSETLGQRLERGPTIAGTFVLVSGTGHSKRSVGDVEDIEP